MGGKGSTTTGELPPEVRGLFTSSSNKIQQAQNAGPLSDYMGSYREGVAPLSPTERNAIGQSQSLFDVSNGPNAMALRSYMSLPDLAASGPTTGTWEPSNLDLRSYMDFLSGPQYGQAGPEADYPGYDSLPALGPDVRDPLGPDTGGGGGGGGRRPIIQPTPDSGGSNPSAQSSVPYADQLPPTRRTRTVSRS